MNRFHLCLSLSVVEMPMAHIVVIHSFVHPRFKRLFYLCISFLFANTYIVAASVTIREAVHPFSLLETLQTFCPKQLMD